jgi:di/tricarboxylate transporter
MGRALLLLTIVIALAKRLGFGDDSKGRTGMVLAVGMGVTMPAFNILPSNVPNMALIGSAEAVHGIAFRYGDYFLLNFTVMGVLAFLIIPILLIVFFKDQPKADTAPVELTDWSREERSLLVILLVTVSFWASDFLHGLSPAWVALGAAIACIMPRFGVMAASEIKTINFGPWIFVAGVIGLGAVANHTGLADTVGTALLGHIDFASGSGFQNYLSMVGLGMVVSLFTSHPAAPAIMTPLATGLAESTGWSLTSVLMVQVPTWVVFMLPYQAPPMLIALTVGGLRLSRVLPVMAAYFLFGLVVILPAHYLWGRYLGYWP